MLLILHIRFISVKTQLIENAQIILSRFLFSFLANDSSGSSSPTRSSSVNIFSTRSLNFDREKKIKNEEGTKLACTRVVNFFETRKLNKISLHDNRADFRCTRIEKIELARESCKFLMPGSIS